MERSGKIAAVLGASSNPERYSNKAINALLEAGWTVHPVNPAGGSICGQEVMRSLKDVPKGVDLLTVYVNPAVSAAMSADVLALAPRLTVFNPGAENPELASLCAGKGLGTLDACTLVMLGTGQL